MYRYGGIIYYKYYLYSYITCYTQFALSIYFVASLFNKGTLNPKKLDITGLNVMNSLVKNYHLLICT